MALQLKLEQLGKTHHSPDNGGKVIVFENITCTINKGEFVSIVGPSGCGKTTLLRIIAGLDKPTNGQIQLNGDKIKTRDDRVGLVFQEFALFPWRTTRKNIEMGLEIQKIPRIQRKHASMEYIEAFGLSGFENVYPKNLSGGMKQRVAIARTLVTNPQLVLMDEPFGSLDSQTRNDMQNFLIRVWQNRKETILFVTHNVDEAVYLSDRILVMSKRPSQILEDIPIKTTRPRDRTSAESNRIRKKILDLLK